VAHVAAGIPLPEQDEIELPVRVGVHLNGYRRRIGLIDLHFIELAKVEARLVGRLLGHPVRRDDVAFGVVLQQPADTGEAVLTGGMEREIHVCRLRWRAVPREPVLGGLHEQPVIEGRRQAGVVRFRQEFPHDRPEPDQVAVIRHPDHRSVADRHWRAQPHPNLRAVVVAKRAIALSSNGIHSQIREEP